MHTVYRVNSNELDSRFLRSVKTLFKDKEIEIAVCEASDVEEDETAYLLKSPANREPLLTAIENVAQNRNLIEVDLESLQ